MAFFKDLPDDAGVRHILQLNKPAGRALVELHEALMRSDSPLGPQLQELIAAYVSGLNQCQYCVGVHGETAKAFGVPEKQLEQLLADPETAGLDPKLLPLLEYVRLLTQSPHSLVQADADRVFGAGWSERQLHDAILTAGLFNFMNRLLDGHGVKGGAEIFRTRGRQLRDSGYRPLLEFLR